MYNLCIIRNWAVEIIVKNLLSYIIQVVDTSWYHMRVRKYEFVENLVDFNDYFCHGARCKENPVVI